LVNTSRGIDGFAASHTASGRSGNANPPPTMARKRSDLPDARSTTKVSAR